jgi:hypothetical protein
MSTEIDAYGYDIPQVRGGAWYQPYNDDGYWAKTLSTEASVIGGLLPINSIPVKYGIIKGSQAVGYGIGWTVDNWNALESNFNTFMTDLNRWQNWMGPLSGWEQ